MGLFSRRPALSEAERRRVPPGQHLTEKFPVLSFGPTPEVDLEAWDLKVFGSVQEPQQWDWKELRSLPSTEITADIHCVTAWSRLGDSWSGVPFREVMARARPAPEAAWVIAHCEYGYSTSLPLSVLDDDDVLLCWGWNGADLAPDHGWPLRLLVPKKYFWKSAKWLRGLEFAAENRLGFWERRGYHDGADPWTEQRYW